MAIEKQTLLDKAIELVRNRLERWYFLKTFNELLNEVNLYVFIEAPKEIQKRYIEYLNDAGRHGGDPTDFRGMHFPGQWITLNFNHDAEGYYEKSDIILHGHYETVESLAWILLHELGHRIIHSSEKTGDDRSLYLISTMGYMHRKNYDEENGPGSFDNAYLLNDTVHENAPEEVVCNMLATGVIGKDLNRHWWRKHKHETS